jgi:S-adenosylmethionine:tRNA ribosyltransferase-isomerase
VKIEDFHFDLPPELIAQRPLAQRGASRLLAVDGQSGACRDLQFADLPTLLRPGDLLVCNNTRVVPARLAARKPTGGAVEILLERVVDDRHAWVQMRASKALPPGLTLAGDGGPLQILERQADLFLVAFPQAPLAYCARYGQVPLPPYISRAADAADAERYQSVFARTPGAVAAPTASLHFDAELLARLAAAGVARAELTLHVGAGTFQPIRVRELSEHRMHAEWVEVPATTIAACRETRARGGRVIAVGTTVVRALESAAAGGAGSAGPGFMGDTRLFIYPGYRFAATDAMITNFHLPQSSLLMLVAAFAGRDPVLAAYRHAVSERYRFFSYGDAMWLTPGADARGHS